MSSKLVLIDVSWLAHRAKHTMGGKDGLSHGDDPTRVIYGCLEQIRQVCMSPRVRSNRVAICFDGPKQFCLRRRAYPPYKVRDKERTPEEQADHNAMFKQLRTLRKYILPIAGFPVLRQCGLEADDVIAQAASQLGTDDGVIITADQDLYQCITDYVHWYDPSRNHYVDREALLAETRLGPSEFAEMKCVAGCRTDTVKGVPGVGEKTATDYIWQLLPPTSAKKAAIQSPEGRRVVQRNVGLVVLPHAATKPVDLTPPEYASTAFFAECERLGFKSFLEGRRRTEWDMFFSGVMDVEERQAAGARKRGEAR